MERAELQEELRPLVAVLTELGEVIHDAMSEQAAARADLAAQLAQRIEEQRADERRQARRSHWTLVALAVLLLFCVALGYSTVANRSVLRKINAVTGPAAQARQAASTRAILASNAVETDCRSRRQQVRLPAPAPAPPAPAGMKPDDLAKYFAGYSCANQTPKDVYPGVAGEPAKGEPAKGNGP